MVFQLKINIGFIQLVTNIFRSSKDVSDQRPRCFCVPFQLKNLSIVYWCQYT